MRTLIAVVCAILLLMGMAGLVRAQGKPAGTMDMAQVKALYVNMACAECHGEEGRTPRWATTPIIAGQNPRYSYLVMKAYKTGERTGVGANQHSEVSELLNDEQLKQLAEYIATFGKPCQG